jgi:predicted nuclease of predicted toxin-antitoxin system
MTVRFYFDEHMRRLVAEGLIERSIEVIMAVDAGMAEKDDDSEHLPYATERGLVLVTFDRPFAGRVMSRSDHAGLICISEKFRNDIGGIIRILVAFSEQHTMSDVAGRVFWLK